MGEGSLLHKLWWVSTAAGCFCEGGATTTTLFFGTQRTQIGTKQLSVATAKDVWIYGYETKLDLIWLKCWKSVRAVQTQWNSTIFIGWSEMANFLRSHATTKKKTERTASCFATFSRHVTDAWFIPPFIQCW